MNETTRDLMNNEVRCFGTVKKAEGWVARARRIARDIEQDVFGRSYP